MLPQKLERHLELFIQNSSVEATVTNSFLYNFSTKNAYLPWRDKLYSDDLINDFISLKAGWQTGDVLWKRLSLNDLRYNEILLSSQDWEFHVKAILLDIKFIFDTRCFSHIRHTPNSIKNSINKDKIIAQFFSRKSILEFNEKYKKINNKGYLYILHELFDYFRFFALHKKMKYAFEAFKWILKITIITKAYSQFWNELVMKSIKKRFKKVK